MDNVQFRVNQIQSLVNSLVHEFHFRQSRRDFVLPMLVLRRLDCLLQPTKAASVNFYHKHRDTMAKDELDLELSAINGGFTFYNISEHDLTSLVSEPNTILDNFTLYVGGYSENIRVILDNYGFLQMLQQLSRSGVLVRLIEGFIPINLYLDTITYREMGSIFEKLLQNIWEATPDTESGFYTPPDVTNLMASLLVAGYGYDHKQPYAYSVYDPVCGTGGLLSATKKALMNSLSDVFEVNSYGQDLNRETAAICQSRMLLYGESFHNVRIGNTLCDDLFESHNFDFVLGHPPSNQDWRNWEDAILAETKDPGGRFKAGIPRGSDSSLLYVQHMISKLSPEGGRLAVLVSVNPMFVGDAGSGDSAIRRWIIESDLVEAVVALPTSQFYHAGRQKFIWIISTSKSSERSGKVHLINAIDFYEKLRKGYGAKRRNISNEQIETIVQIYSEFENSEISLIKENSELGYLRVVIDRPQVVDEKLQLGRNGQPMADREKRRFYEVPLNTDLDEFFRKEIASKYTDSWMNYSLTKIGYAIQFYYDFIGQRIKRVAEPMRLREIQLSTVVIELNLSQSRESPGYIELANAVYLPLVGNSDAMSNTSELSMQPRNYIQLVLDPKLVSSEYLAQFFNSALGLLIRRQVSTGAYIERINKRLLFNANVYIPKRERQLDMIAANAQISEILSELDDLKSELWSSPQKYTAVIKAFDNVVKQENRELRFEEWLDTVPFPLASILWTYHASGQNNKIRYEHLLHFFEAMAEFLATLLLSGFRTDQPLYESQIQTIARIINRQNLSFEYPSFGTWKAIVEWLSSQMRKLLKNDKSRSDCYVMFRTTDDEILSVICSSSLVGVIQETNALRNKWVGHGGIVSDATAKERHQILRSHISTVRQVFGTSWERYLLVLPGRTSFKGGIYSYRAKRLMGNRTPFEDIVLRVEHPLEDGTLHFVAENETSALQLLPLIKVMPSPRAELDACYFFNRRASEGDLRFVSYHFEQEADITDVFSDTADLLETLTNVGSNQI